MLPSILTKKDGWIINYYKIKIDAGNIKSEHQM
jgi:hypothetical protein